MPSAPIHFGTDGWRGIMADDFTFPNVRRVATAAAAYFKSVGHPSDGVLIGYDRRFLSQSFAEAIAQIFLAEGFPSVKISRTSMTTPSMSVMVKDEKAAWGIMITASHNPAVYNGFKIKSADGCSAPPTVTDLIEQGLASVLAAVPSPTARPLESFFYEKNYDRYLKSRLDWKLLQKSKATVVFDSLYGAGAGIPERLLKSASLKIKSIHSVRDPLFGGLHPEPIDMYLGDLKKEVRKQHALVGIATDGDADRLGVVDDLGRYLTPHQVFPLLLLHAIERGQPKGKVVQSVSLGVLGERIAKAYQLEFEEVPVGFKHVAERMLREEVLAGGEESGGYAFSGGLPERDGILCGLLFLEMCIQRRQRPSKLLAQLEKRFGAARFNRIDIALSTPIIDKRTFVETILKELPKEILRSSILEKRTLDGLKIVLSDGSWVLLRPSGTEPLVRTYAESASWKKTHALLAWAESTVRAHL